MLRNLMNRIRMNRTKKKRGFTLIELIIVIVIIAIIAAFAIPNFIKVQENAKKDADVNLGRTIAHTVEVMVADGAIKKDKDGKYTDIDLVVKNDDGKPTTNTTEIPKRIQEEIKEGGLKLQTKGAGTTLTIKIDDNGKVESITEEATAANKIYSEPGGIYVK